MTNANPKVDWYFSSSDKWKSELLELRKIALATKLVEELKWGKPCYTFEGNNIVLIHAFKAYCALLLFKGALLEDADGLLVQQTENTQSARQIRFVSVKDIIKKRKLLAAYIEQAIAVEKAGLKVAPRKTSEFVAVEEFQNKLKSKPELKAAFESLTPGRQRGYLLYFAAAKHSKTREARVEKSISRIFAGKGMDDE